MKIIKIKKSGKIFLEETVDKDVKISAVKGLKNYLSCEVEIDEDVTFGTFFKLIVGDKDVFDVVFCQELNGRKLGEFGKMLDEDLVDEGDFKLDFLEISKIFELLTFDKVSTIDLFPVFVGMGKTSDGFDLFIPISICSVNELKNIKISQNNLVEVYRDNYHEGCESMDDENLISFFDAATRITLYEAIRCILFEIAYYKTEEERLKIRKNQNNEQMNKNKIEILNIQLKKYIEDDDFEKAAVAKRELDRLKTIINIKKT